MNPDFRHDHFQLFGLPVAYAIDLAVLESHYRELQTKVHPDRFSRGSEAEKRLAMQWATRVNEGYQTLRKPLSRAVYLLSLRGIEALSERHTAIAPGFLMQQMDWREAIAEARAAADQTALDAVARELRDEIARLEARLHVQLDSARDDAAAAESARQYTFMLKLLDDVRAAQDHLDAA
jgi:molecular chaperone HscB